ncbi:DUF6428 family protein [Psychroflexus sp. CAK57W]|uniref:DUF6428 family protein n=1 Tax=Psychroflexus curvus TaxID=2873595 RepID=UPI001CCC0297|nr:DUF6428 family protein [Psychroflexus curvus]MBZ9627222.1 DUF6428 family protein [Psychroflexus curvus]MBZ9787216.1 DUF6428 family protein [Psychroflexus curvus]
MTLKQVKEQLAEIDTLQFQLPDGSTVPSHFHVTEVGQVSKDFIDCGGSLRHEKVVNFQLWNDVDIDHRLQPKKLKNIIQLSEKKLFIDDRLEVEVEYQGETIGKYHLDFNDGKFYLVSTLTDCLAKDKCGIPEPEEVEQSSCCTPESGCC